MMDADISCFWCQQADYFIFVCLHHCFVGACLHDEKIGVTLSCLFFFVGHLFGGY